MPKWSEVAALSREREQQGQRVRDDWEAKWRRSGPPEDAACPEGPAGPARLDAPHPLLEQELLVERSRLAAGVERELRAYDEAAEYPRRQDAEHACRDGYEVHLWGQAAGALRARLDTVATRIARQEQKQRLASVHLCGEKAKPPTHTVLIALMAVHIATEGRLKKLQHTLQSIQEQDLSGTGIELHVAVSWYAPVPALAAKVQAAFHRLINTRAPHSATVPRGNRAEGRGSFSRLASQVQPVSTSQRPLTVVTRQTERRTQFQHYRAALAALESQLRHHWSIPADSEARHSVWVIFGDDDDLWHPRRAAEFGLAIKRHPQVEGVGAFATLTRAGVSWHEGQQGVPDCALPVSAGEVDEFMTRGRQGRHVRGANHADDDACQKWLRKLCKEGSLSTDIPPPESLSLEHYDFSPRLRILREFFRRTPEHILEHRLCDLRLCAFLETYPRLGEEFGLQLSFFNADCWMYFYRNVGLDHDELRRATEQTDDQQIIAAGAQPDAIFAQKEHVSAEVPIQSFEIQFAADTCDQFQEHDSCITHARLTRYLAVFRSMMEHHLVRLHSRKIDQRRFDGLVAMTAVAAFGSFADMALGECAYMTSESGRMLLDECQRFAKGVAAGLGVGVLWHKPRFLMPELSLTPMPSSQELQFATADLGWSGPEPDPWSASRRAGARAWPGPRGPSPGARPPLGAPWRRSWRDPAEPREEDRELMISFTVPGVAVI